MLLDVQPALIKGTALLKQHGIYFGLDFIEAKINGNKVDVLRNRASYQN